MGRKRLSDFITAKAKRDELEAAVKKASFDWNAIVGVGSGPMGLTPDAVRLSPEYRAAKQRYQRAHLDLRSFNADFVKRYADELTAERMNRRLALMGKQS
jgi:hypothetical protein